MNELLRSGLKWIGFLFLIGQWENLSYLHGQELIQPAPDMPIYNLGSINQTKDALGRLVVSIDYKRTKEGVGVPVLAGRVSGGPLRIAHTGPLIDESGQLQITELITNGEGHDGVVYLIVSGSFAEECDFNCLVSNVVRFGNLATETAAAREWNPSESSAYQKELLGRKPPYGVPDGHQLVRASTKLIAGMPVKVGRYGKWVDAEALTSEATVIVKISGAASLLTCTRNGWLAIEPGILQKGAASPGSFKPSVRVIPGTAVVLPDGFERVNEATNLVAGAPVRAIWRNQLLDATVIAIEEDSVLTHYDDKPDLLDKQCVRGELVIAETTLEELAKPDAAERFQARVPKRPSADEQMGTQQTNSTTSPKRIQAVADGKVEGFNHEKSSAGSFADLGGESRPITLQNNPIDLPIPREAELLPLDFPIPRGTKLAACSGQRWNYVTVLKDSKEDTVTIHWDDRTPDHDGLIHRTQLIIRKSDLKKLKLKATRSERRIWTDATGKHTIEATLSSRTSTQVTIKRDDGKEVTLSIEKLSEADKKWLRENP